ncbi:MAG: CHAT domain-containing protein [Streptosporangiales bacterium]|nr:CHAT domain-containing protein [Streptosporangiales bacterium]
MGEDLSGQLAAAEHAVNLASVDPERARAEAEAVLAATDAPESLVVASRALGLAYRELGDADAADQYLRKAIRRAEAAGLDRRAGEARMSLVGVLADRGDLAAALAEADAAAPVLRGADAGRLLAQRALVLGRAGRLDDALASYREALRQVRQERDPRFEAGILNNLGTLQVYRGEVRLAEATLRRCVEVASRAGLNHLATLARANLAFAAMRRGDIPRALALFDEVENALDTTGGRVASIRLDRAEALLTVRLVGEARTVLASTIESLKAGGFAADLAEARLMLARAELQDEDSEAATRTAVAARDDFARQGRVGWAVLAEYIAVQARADSGERSEQLLLVAQRVAGELARRGWAVPAAHSRIVAGRVAVALGRLTVAERELAEAGSARNSGPVGLRASAWEATALHRLAQHDRRGARAALVAGLRVVEEHTASLGCTELRVHAAEWGQDLASLGLYLAFQSRRPRAVLAWAERWRAGALRLAPARPPHDPWLAETLAELRGVVDELTKAAAEGAETRALRTTQVRLEREVRQRSRHTRGARHQPSRLSVRELVEALGERALIELIRYDETLVAVTAVEGRFRLWPLGGYDDALRAMGAMRFFLHRLARRHGTAASLEAARKGLRHAADQLDADVLRPLRGAVGDRELVIVPTGRLHALPWSALPSIADRPVTIAPSAQVWLNATGATRRRRNGGAVLIAGPGLDHADAEVTALHARYEPAVALTGEEASADAVRTALDGADLAHIAAHGRFRTDNPLFSFLYLADGPFMVYDLERLASAPRQLVLSACDTALSAVRPGDELTGVASAFLSLGTETLVASVTPVHDDETRELMVAFHDRLAADLSPARALAEATRTSGVLGFVCFGAG